jgi:hypothetical protein
LSRRRDEASSFEALAPAYVAWASFVVFDAASAGGSSFCAAPAIAGERTAGCRAEPQAAHVSFGEPEPGISGASSVDLIIVTASAPTASVAAGA